METEFKYRCPICYQIPFLSSNFNDQNLIINMKCLNNHENKDEISNIQNKNIKCNKCGETKNKEFYYCGSCSKILCNKCCDSHKNEGHKIIELKNVDFICSEHNNNFVGYCQKHNINYCKNCQHFKENNSNVFKELSEKEISNFIEINNKNESLLLDFDKHFQTLKKYFEDVQRIYNLFKNNIENKIKFYENHRITLTNQLNSYFSLNTSENYKLNIENIENQMKENEKENLNELNKEKENFENLIISLNDIDPTIQKEIVQTINSNDNYNNNKNKEKIINFIKTNKEKFIDKLN